MRYLRDAAIGLGGVCLGGALATVLHQEFLPLYILAGLTLFAVAGGADWLTRRPQRLSDRALRRQARDTAQQLNEFLADRQRESPAPPLIPVNASDAQKETAEQQRQAASVAHLTETTNRFKVRFQSRALALLTELERRGVVTLKDNERVFLTGPMMPHGIEILARVLGIAGEDLTD